MAAARYSSDVLQTFYGSIPKEENRNQPQTLKPNSVVLYDRCLISQNNFQDWLRIWRMAVSEENPNNKDLLVFARETNEKFTDLVENEIQKLKSVKVSFGLQVEFSIERDGETQYMEHYFRENEPHVFNRNDEDQIKKEFDRFVERIKGEIESWSERGSGWVLERIMTAYVNVARYQPLRGGTYLPLPANLEKKKAIINVQNRDNECLKWALRAALFPPQDGKNPQRPNKYPVNDDINYEGIDFPTPVKHIDKLEAKNKNLAINVFGWENNCVVVHRISRKAAEVPRINLMLIESGIIQHYCYVKRVSALLCDQTKNSNTKHYCMMCLTGFSRADLLENHKKYCNGVNDRPTRIEMPEEGKNTLSFQNHHKQMKVPYVIYADFEALVRKIPGCEIGPESKKKSYTEKTEWHEACGYSYMVVRIDGEVSGSKVYRGENAVGTFLNDILQEEVKIRDSLAEKKPIVMEPEEWVKFKNATDCHICNKSLIKDEFLDSLPVWSIEGGEGSEKCSYRGQWHKKCFYRAQKEQQWGILRLKRLTDKKDKLEAKFQKNCRYCGNSLLQKNFRDAVKDHCHITGRYRGAAHNECNLKLRINPQTYQIPVVFHNLRGYDAHHLMQAMSQLKKEVKCVANNMEKYITFSVGGLRFIDSFNFLQASLDSLVSATPKESLKITSTISKGSDLLYKKGIYPYEYMDSWGRFSETRLPDKEKFYSKLNDEHITDEEYAHAKTVWVVFECKTLGDYHDLYVKTDVALLADVFENFRNICQEQYGLDPAHHYTSPGLSWDALLKKTGVELELFTDLEMHLFVERGMRGGISMVSKRYAKANNPLVPDYDSSKSNKYIMYLDANNLYGWAMSKPLPKRDFKWKRVMPTEEDIIK